MVKKQIKVNLQKNITPKLQSTCHLLNNALNSIARKDLKSTWGYIRTATIDQIKNKSSSNTLKRTRSLFSEHSYSQP